MADEEYVRPQVPSNAYVHGLTRTQNAEVAAGKPTPLSESTLQTHNKRNPPLSKREHERGVIYWILYAANPYVQSSRRSGPSANSPTGASTSTNY
jgi:hypothetical protein